MNKLSGLVVAVLGMHLTACTWVDMTAQGEKVRVLSAEEVTACKRVGKTNVMTAAKVAGMERHAFKITEELNALARNSAAEMGGDTVVPVGEPVDGRQVYEVYHCMP